MRRGERGSAFLEVLVLGFLIFLMVTQALVIAGRLQAAGEMATEAAQVAALEAARHGDITTAREVAERLAPGSAVSTRLSGDQVLVEVSVVVPLPGHSVSLVGRGAASVSPYRSAK
ncbi:MAG: hypothetical protein ACRDXD_01055 [Acidimicrobiia bacterium]